MRNTSNYAKHIIKCYKEDMKCAPSKKMRLAGLYYGDERTSYFVDKMRKYYSFPYLYSALFYDPEYEDICYIRDIANDIVLGRDLISLNDIMKMAPHESCMPDFDEWGKLNNIPNDYREGDRSLLVLGSMHPDGYVREQCLRRLSKHRSILQYILFRLNDNVPAVRNTAREILTELLKNPDVERELIDAMPAVESVRNGGRIDRSFMDELDRILIKVFKENIKSVSYSTETIRKQCYRVFEIHPDVNNCDAIIELFKHEKNGEYRCMLERLYLQMAPKPIAREIIELFNEDSYEGVRRLTYSYRLQQEGIWDDFTKLLGSHSRRIRKYAEQQLSKNGFDVLGYCRNHLPDMILALSDIGTGEDMIRIKPYMEIYPCETLTALVRLHAKDSSRLLFYGMQSENSILSKTAYRLARREKCFSTEQLLAMIHNTQDPILQWREICLMTKDGVWQVMPHLIRLADEYPKLCIDIQYLIKKNLNTKVKLPKELNQEIQKALRERKTAAIPSEINNRIFFAMM